MQLSRKKIYHLGIASQLFQREAQLDDALPREQKKLNVSVTARMFIRKNAKEISEMFDMIKEEEKGLAESFYGYQIEALGYMQFFEGKKELEAFQKSEEKFVLELSALRTMGNGIAQNGDKEALKKVDADFALLRTKYIKPGDPQKAAENLKKYNDALNKFMNDEEGTMDFKVQPIKAKWFENTDSLPQAFVDHYDEAGLIDYEV